MKKDKKMLKVVMVLALLFSSLSGLFLISAYAEGNEAEYISKEEKVESGTFVDMLKKANTSGGTVKLLQNITFASGSSGAQITGDSVTLDLNGYEIASTYGTSGTRPITVKSNGVLTLIDSKVDSNTSGNIKNGVQINNGGVFTMKSGSISNSEKFNGVNVSSGGKFVMDGGSISNNTYTSSSGGGGVSNYGTFIMNGGEIKNNTVSWKYVTYGGGVCSKGITASFTMNDGSISGNKATSDNSSASGGGVYINAEGAYSDSEDIKEFLAFTMNGGTISQNTTDGYGGGVYIVCGGYKNCYSVFNMNGGTISENKSERSGGGIYIDNNSRVNITKGSISNNESGRSGGGIGIYNTFTTGGAWASYMPGELHLKNVVISGNIAENYIYNGQDYGSYGGGIATCPTSATYVYLTDGGAIYGNTSSNGELLAQQINPSTSHQHLLYLSGYMLGGGAYNWTDLKGNEIIANRLMDLETDDFMVTNKITKDSQEAKTANNLAKVFITGNKASYMGGGIMNNGILEIGTSDASLRVEKQVINGEDSTSEFQFIAEFWTKENTTETKIPYSKQISYMKSGDEKVTSITLNDEGKTTFKLSANEYIVFYGLDEDLYYKISEIPSKNYEMKVTNNAEGVIQKKETLEAIENIIFTNVYIKPIVGDLTVSKEVTGTHGDINKEFHFTVTLEDKTISGKYGDMEFKNGVSEMTLKHGQSVTAIGLPAGVKYTVNEVEADQNGYKTSSINESGSILENETATVIFTNSKNIIGNLVLKKEVTGTHGDENKEFHFTVTLEDKTINGKYGDMEFKNGVSEMTLKHGQSVTAIGLPAGVKYTVDEVEADQNGYETSSINESGIVPENDTVEITFINSKKEIPNIQVTPSTPDEPKISNTGDSTNIGLWGITLALSSGIAIIIGKKHKKNRNV